MGSYRPSSYIIAKWMIIAQCSRVTSMITPANRNAAVIIVNRRHITAPVKHETLQPTMQSTNQSMTWTRTDNKIQFQPDPD